MSFLAIVAAAPDGRVAKYAEFDTQAEADAHVATYGGFAAEHPGAPWSHWLIDMVAKTISIDVPPVEPHTVSLPTFLSRLSDADADTVMTWLDGKNAKLRERLRLEGIPSDQTQVRNWLTTNGYDPDVVLARE